MFFEVEGKKLDYEEINGIINLLLSEIKDIVKKDEEGKDDILNFKVIFNNETEVDVLLFIHILIYSYLIQFDTYDNNEEFYYALRIFVKNKIKNLKENQRIALSYTDLSKNEIMINQKIIEIYKKSYDVFLEISRLGQKKIKEVIIEKNINLNNILENNLKEEFSIKENFTGTLENFEKIIKNEMFDEENDEFSNLKHLYEILKDTVLLLFFYYSKKMKIEDKINLKFTDNSWFIYLLSLIFCNYENNNANIFKKSDLFLKYGIDMNEFENLIKGKGLNFEEEIKMFYLLNCYGASKKMNLMPNDEGEILIEIVKNPNKIESFNFNKDKKNLFIENFVEILFLTGDTETKQNIKNFYTKIQTDVEESVILFKGVFNSLTEYNHIVLFNELKEMYNNISLEEKDEFLKTLMFAFIKNKRKTLDFDQKNEIYSEMLKNLTREISFEIQFNNFIFLKDKIFFYDNIFDEKRLIAEENFLKIFDELKENAMVEEKDLKEYEEKEKEKNKLKEEAKITIFVNSGISLQELKEEKKELFFVLIFKLFVKILLYKKKQKQIIKKEIDESDFNIMLDILTLIEFKNRGINFYFDNFCEIDYLIKYKDKIENFFSVGLIKNDKIVDNKFYEKLKKIFIESFEIYFENGKIFKDFENKSEDENEENEKRAAKMTGLKGAIAKKNAEYDGRYSLIELEEIINNIVKEKIKNKVDFFNFNEGE